VSGTIRVNGRDRPLDEATLAALLAREGIDAALRGVAVALNGAVVPRASWTRQALAPGDVIEIVRPYRGG
jgi:sulfur carrier protein